MITQQCVSGDTKINYSKVMPSSMVKITLHVYRWNTFTKGGSRFNQDAAVGLSDVYGLPTETSK